MIVLFYQFSNHRGVREMDCVHRPASMPPMPQLKPTWIVLGSMRPLQLMTREIRIMKPSPPASSASPEDTTTKSIPDNNNVGLWLARRQGRRAATTTVSSINASPSPGSLFASLSCTVRRILLPKLVDEVLATMAPKRQGDVLEGLYFEKIHPIFPVLDEASYRLLATTDPARNLLRQGICLAASRNLCARDHLKIENTLHSPKEFGKRILGAMRLSIELGLVEDRVVLIQALALMSLFGDGPDDISSQLCARAVHHVHSTGLHQRWRNRHDEGNKYAIRLLCCIWALDRMNAAFYGRPVMMHERDIGSNLVECFETQDAPFRLFLDVASVLDNIITLYRPSLAALEERPEFGLSSFEELVVTCQALQVSTDLLGKSYHITLENIADITAATIETLYLAVAILSCRTRNSEDLDPSSHAFLRQRLATTQITTTVIKELNNLIQFPFVPYTISLALSSTYRELRHSKLPLQRSRAIAQFKACCASLESLGGIWSTAANMAEMGRRVLGEMERVAGEHRRAQGDGSRRASIGDEGLVQRVQNEMVPAPPAVPQQPNISELQPFENSAINPTVFDPAFDFDLFGLFDPAFDLPGMDACLEGNLDLGFGMGMGCQ
jgi:hypothetical protein